MPEYQYTALTANGTESSGLENAPSIDALTLQLKRRRMVLLKAKEIKTHRIPFTYTLRLIIELNDLIGSGLVLERALQIIASDSSDEKFAQLCDRIRQQLKGGQSLSQALNQIGRFDPLLVPLIQAGEASGRLSETLNILDQYYQNKKQLQGDIIASLAYPAILVLVSILSLIALALYVIPVFKDIFADNMDKLPLGTIISFRISDWLSANGGYLFLAITGTVMLCTLAIRHSEAVRFTWHQLLLHLPLVGPLLSQSEAAKSFNVLSVLLKSDVPLVKSMQITQAVLSTLPQQQGMENSIRQLKQGKPLSQALDDIPFLPVIARRLVAVGDESGNLSRSCEKAAAIIQRELRSSLKALVAMLEPAVILIMGGVIGFVIISMLLAVFSMSDLV